MARSRRFLAFTDLLKNTYRSEARGHSSEQAQEERERERETVGEMRASRRDLVRAAGASLVVAGVSPISAFAKTTPKATPKALGRVPSSEDAVAIIGAGAAGLAAAYELRKDGIPFVLYEASTRFGGRMFTDDKTFAAQGQFCELGAELVNSTHPSIRSLAGELDVALEDFPEGDAGLIEEIYFYQGRRYTESEIIRAARPLIRAVARDLKAIYGDKPLEVITYRSPFRSRARAFDQMNLSEYLTRVPELETWLRVLIEAAYVVEYGKDAAHLSALSFLYIFASEESERWKTYGESDELSRIRGGSSRLLEATHKAIGGDERIRFGHELLKVGSRGSRLELTFRTDGGTRSHRHDQVVIAAPFSVLREVDGFKTGRGALELSPVKARAIRELSYGMNSKMMLGFEERLWRFPKSGQGSTGAVIGSGFATAIWETSRLQPGAPGILTHYMGGRKAIEANATKIAPTIADIDVYFPGVGALYNQRNAIMNWSTNKWAKGSYSSPSPGQYTTLFGAGHEPELRGRLLFAGEHTSIENYGYMDGAVDSGFRVANAIARARGKRRKTG